MNTNYTQLPPGRSRRLAYSDYIQRRTNRFNRTRNLQNILTYNSIQLPRIVSYYPNNITSHQYNYITTTSYDFLSNLQDVKIGLLNKNLLKNSQITQYKNDESNICVICQDDIENNNIIRKIKCNHEFHINCIDTWLCENKKCPVCKFDLDK